MRKETLLFASLLCISGHACAQSQQASQAAEKLQVEHADPAAKTKTVPDIAAPRPPATKALVPTVESKVGASQPDCHDCKPEKSWMHELQTDPIATFTGLLFVATVALWWATRRLVRQAHELSQQELRAYVSVELTVEHNIVIPGKRGFYVRITPVWRNTGGSPTKKMRMFVVVDLHIRPEQVASDAVFKNAQFRQEAFIGPRSAVEGAPLTIPNEELISPAHAESDRRFIWGAAEYLDVFGHGPWRTEFCCEIVVSFEPGAFVDQRLSVRFAAYGRHNRADEECREG